MVLMMYEVLNLMLLILQVKAFENFLRHRCTTSRR